MPIACGWFYNTTKQRNNKINQWEGSIFFGNLRIERKDMEKYLESKCVNRANTKTNHDTRKLIYIFIYICDKYRTDNAYINRSL